METETSIANKALMQIGAKRITSLAENSVEAEVCAEFYPFIRNKILSSSEWGFASKRASLVKLSTTPIGYAYAYSYPADALKIRRLYQSDTGEATITDDPIPYKIAWTSLGVKEIWTDYDDAGVCYTAGVDNTGAYNTLFYDALVFALAAAIAYPLTRDANLSALMERKAYTALAFATGSDAREEAVNANVTNLFVDARK